MTRTPLIRRALVATLGSVVAAASFVAFTASPASADWDGCAATGYMCVYKNANGSSGGFKAYAGNDGQYSNNNFSGCSVNCNVNDNVSSQWNRESYTVRSYQGAGYGPSAMDTSSGAAWYSMPGGYGDSLSSHQGI